MLPGRFPFVLAPVDVVDADRALRRELYFFTLYRLLEAAMLVLVVFGPMAELIAPPQHQLFARSIALAYMFVAVLLFLLGLHGELRGQTLAGIASDLFFGILAINAVPEVGTGIALMLVFNVGAASLLLRTRHGVGVAVAAALGVIAEYAWSVTFDDSQRTLAEPIMFGIAYLAIATLTSVLGRQMRASYDLANRRGAETAHVVEVNELIIRRLRTGVLLVDGDNNIRLANEAATSLLGDAGDGHRNLLVAMPELGRRLTAWREIGVSDETALQVAPDQPEVMPRFTRLLAGSDQTLIFLDDTTQASRRAESMTLATLGRFSASLAHEIRNPLAAINYAAQLLEESRGIPVADRRLLEIVRQQGTRMNGIIENVLGLARRQPAQLEYVELVAMTAHFVDDYRASHPLEHDTLESCGSLPAIAALVDPRQLHQVLTVLVHNALLYGRMPGAPARVSVRVHVDSQQLPVVDVRDRGPGIPELVVTRLFKPFFTTSPHGTGLGLYIARELCLANQATLEFVALPGGGSCFRIQLCAAVTASGGTRSTGPARQLAAPR